MKELIEVNGLLTADITNFIESISRTIEIYEYHKFEALSLIQAIESNSGSQAFKLIMDQNQELYYKQLAVQAHIQSAIHNARSLYDLTAQLFNAILIEEKYRLRINKCSIQDVAVMLCNPELKAMIEQVISTESYKYVNGFVNTIKHRNLVKLNSAAYFDPFKNMSISFDAFSFNKVQYPSRSAKDALQVSLDVKNNIISIGESLERHLSIQV